MAKDWLMLEAWPEDCVRFRYYGWATEAFTFGYRMTFESVPHGYDLCRRPTGGGIVDHRNDWTYCLVIPVGHPWHRMRAIDSYEKIHSVLVNTLNEMGRGVELAPCDCDGKSVAHCFAKAEPYDIVLNGQKVAGGAQKRTKDGLLFQGSVGRAALPGLDWEAFESRVTENFGKALEREVNAKVWPEAVLAKLSEKCDYMAGDGWAKRR